MSEQTRELVRLRQAMMASGDLVYEWDIAKDRIDWSGSAAASVFGLGAMPPISGMALRSQILPEDLVRRQNAIDEHLATRAPYECEYRLRLGDGSVAWVHDRAIASFDDSGNPMRIVGVIRAITSRKQNEERLEYLANYDDLTGHYNRTRLREALDHALIFATRHGLPGAYLTVDIDQLTMINDAYGYQAADAVIVAVGHRLDRCLRSSDVIGSLGADRFGIILGNCPETDLATAAERILQAVRRGPIQTPEGPIHVTVSAGGIALPSGAASAHEAMTRTEIALQEAKRSGRNCFIHYRQSEPKRANPKRQVAVAEQVRVALKENRLAFAYQPVVDTKTRTVHHYESLLRMQNEDGTWCNAGAFIPIVEQMGLIRAVDRKTLDMALEELRRSPGVSLALNVSGISLMDGAWLNELSAQLGADPALAQRLILEITETVALQDVEATSKFVNAVRALGAHVTLDDFGAGYTSFRQLKVLAVDGVKIDGSFVRNIATRAENQLFVRSLMALANGFGLTTVAECVETEQEAAVLAREGVAYLQGYLFGRPELERPWLKGGAMPPVAAAPLQPARPVKVAG